jgi:serine protease Do
MQAVKRRWLCALFALFVFPLLAPPARGETLTITSTPPGATVEIDGAIVGTTPYRIDYPGGYFHKPHVVFAARLEHSMTARISKDGYTVQEVKLTEGPMEWVSVTGKDHGKYWLLKAKKISVTLQPVSHVFNGSVRTSLAGEVKMDLRPELPVQKVVEIASPAIVKLRDAEGGWGTGFLITDTGVIATNHHVVRGYSTVTVVLAGGKELLGKVIYTDPDPKLDLAIVKLDGENFPHLPLADLSQVQAGQTVIAIGNPSHGMPDTVTITRGIVSAVGRNAEAGKGTWIQTDAAINPGNSGGPLLNVHGEVIGINTQKRFEAEDGRPLEGIGFALSATDLISVLLRFYPVAAPAPGTPVANGTGSLSITSEQQAEIYVDGKFIGQAPATIRLATGSHHIAVKAEGKRNWERDLEVLKDSELTLHPVLAPQP